MTNSIMESILHNSYSVSTSNNSEQKTILKRTSSRMKNRKKTIGIVFSGTIQSCPGGTGMYNKLIGLKVVIKAKKTYRNLPK